MYKKYSYLFNIKILYNFVVYILYFNLNITYINTFYIPTVSAILKNCNHAVLLASLSFYYSENQRENSLFLSSPRNLGENFFDFTQSLNRMPTLPLMICFCCSQSGIYMSCDRKLTVFKTFRISTPLTNNFSHSYI